MKKWMAAVLLIAAGCSAPVENAETPPGAVSVIDWVEFIKWNDSEYILNRDAEPPGKQWPPGEKLGEIKFMLNGNAGTNYQTKNGDAAYLPAGTAVYEMEGYDPAFRILADGQLYEVNEPEEAETLGDFLDIRGKVEKIVLLSQQDLSIEREFSAEHRDDFVEELLNLPYDPSLRYSTDNKGKSIFFGLILNDGSMTRSSYYPDASFINYGAAASPKLEAIFTEETAE